MAGCCGVMGSHYKISELDELFRTGFFSDDMRILLSGNAPLLYEKPVLLDKAYELFEKIEKGKKITRTLRLEADAAEAMALRRMASDIMDINGEGGYFSEYIQRLKTSVDELREGKQLYEKDLLKLQKFFESMAEYTCKETASLMGY